MLALDRNFHRHRKRVCVHWGGGVGEEGRHTKTVKSLIMITLSFYFLFFGGGGEGGRGCGGGGGRGWGGVQTADWKTRNLARFTALLGRLSDSQKMFAHSGIFLSL